MANSYHDQVYKNPLAAALGTAFLASGVAPMASAEVTNPFVANDLSAVYEQLARAKHDEEGGCGEGKCGGKAAAADEGGCGEGKCGGKAAAADEGGCGEGKCGGKAAAADEGGLRRGQVRRQGCCGR